MKHADVGFPMGTIRAGLYGRLAGLAFAQIQERRGVDLYRRSPQREQHRFLIDFNGSGTTDDEENTRGSFDERYLSGSLVNLNVFVRPHIGVYAQNEEAVAWVMANYPDDVLQYGFKAPYWSNTHHFFFAFFLGYVLGPTEGAVRADAFEDTNHPTSVADYAIGRSGARIGGWFGEDPANQERLPDILQREMCLNTFERAVLQYQRARLQQRK